MANPFLKRFQNSDLVLQTRARNLVWIAVILSVGMVVLTTLLYLDHDTRLPYVTGGVGICFVAILALLWGGYYRTAATFGFVIISVGATASALLNRSGIIEADMFQAIVYFSLALFLIGAFGYTSILAIFIAATGVATLVVIFTVPVALPDQLRTVAELNLQASPFNILLVFGLTGVVATFNQIQMGGLLGSLRRDQEVIAANNLRLEATVQDRTAALRNIMDNTGQGFLTFGSDYIILPNFSRGARDILKRSPAGDNVIEALFPRGSEMAQEFRQGLDLYFSGRTRANVIFDLLEKSAFIQGRYIALDYREAGAGLVLCIMTDVTTERLLQEKNQMEEVRQQLLVRALGNKHYFAGFLAEADQIFGYLETFWKKTPSRADNEALLRQLHTFKGNCGFFGFSRTQEMAHDFEYSLSDSLVLQTEVPYQDFYFDLKKSYYFELKTISDSVGTSWLEEAGGIVVPRPYYNKMLHFIRSKYGHEKRFLAYMEHFTKINLRDLFSRYPYIAAATAEKLGKRIRPMALDVEDLRVSPERFEPLTEACIHIVNNMVDHGIEPGWERESLGKSPEGQLSLTVTEDNDTLTLTFKDDGRGIDPAAVLQAARQAGLVAGDQDLDNRAILKLLFADGFSTRREVSEFSGRGVGLSAAREAVQNLNGTIEISSRVGAGTTFEIFIPLKRRPHEG